MSATCARRRVLVRKRGLVRFSNSGFQYVFIRVFLEIHGRPNTNCTSYLGSYKGAEYNIYEYSFRVWGLKGLGFRVQGLGLRA